MTKAILVIDEMPKRCDQCTLCNTDNIVISDTAYGKCGAKNKDVKAKVYCDGFFQIKKPSWCPLKEMPKKKEIEEKEGMWAVLSSIADNYEDGWNDCIDSILGE